MGNYTTFLMFENPRRGRQARNFTENDPKILDLKSSSEQIIFRKLSLGAPKTRMEAGYTHISTASGSVICVSPRERHNIPPSHLV